jgi:CsoR family transcriptional regulator, copper-sensing transcriptional repressor
MQDTALIHRLNRAIGQIEGIRKKVELGTDDDCLKTLQQLKASINALKKFGEAYMSTHLEACLSEKASKEELKSKMEQVLKGMFSL